MEYDATEKKTWPQISLDIVQLIPYSKWKSNIFQQSVTGFQAQHGSDPWSKVISHQTTNSMLLSMLFALPCFGTYCLIVGIFLDLFLFQFCGVSFLRAKE